MSKEKNLQSAISILEHEMSKLPQIEIDIKHHFSGGVYAREMFVPKGVSFVGKVHKYENLNILSQGCIVITDATGSKTLTAPCTFVSPPGVQRAGLALSDVVWTTIHGSHERDLEKLEAHFVTDTHEQYLTFKQQKLEE